MTTQAGTRLHPAAQPRNLQSTTPDQTAGHRGLTRSLASGTALGPSTTWVPPSDRHHASLTTGPKTANPSADR
jgi:hypothetical protein